MSDNYARAYKELFEIIRYFPTEEYNRIPKETIKYFKDNMDNNYEFTIDPEVDLSKQKISKETYVLIVNLFEACFATEDEKAKIKEILELNKKKSDLEKSLKYNTDDLFKNEKYSKMKTIEVNESTQETSLIERKESFFVRFKNFIIELLHLNK